MKTDQQIQAMAESKCSFSIDVFTYRNSDTALLRLLIDEDSAVVVLLLVGEHVYVQQRLLRAQPVARARRSSDVKVGC